MKRLGGKVQYYSTALGWGYICSPTWSERAAAVACHEFGMKYFACEYSASSLMGMVGCTFHKGRIVDVHVLEYLVLTSGYKD